MSADPFQILLVDDEMADAELFMEVFQEVAPATRIHHVLNGQEALDHLRQPASRPQLIVLDLNMPVMSGHRFLELAKADPSIRGIPVLVLSTSTGAGDIRQSYHLYASGYLVKPSTYAELQALVQVISDYWQGAVRFPTVAEWVGERHVRSLRDR